MKRPLIIASLTLVALALSGCSGGGDRGTAPADAGGLTPFTVGVVPTTDVAPVFIGIKKGFFEEEGLDVTTEMAQGGSALLPAVVAGEYAAGFSATGSIITAVSQGLPLKVVAPGAFSTGAVPDTAGVMTMPDSGITRPADLVGKTVATNSLGNIFVTTISYLVEEDGGDPAGIDWIELPWPDMTAALVGGQIDAATVAEPFVTIAAQAGAVPVLWNWYDVDPNLMMAGWFMVDQFIAENQETTDAFVRGLTRSLEYAKEHPDEVRAIVATYTEIDAGVLEALTMSRFESEIDVDSLQLIADLSSRYGAIPNEIDAKGMIR